MRRAAGLVVGLGAALLAASCGEEIAVRQATRVHADGTIGRTVLIAAREPKRTDPYPGDWISNLTELGGPEAWARVERTATSIRAEGVFPTAAEIPATLRHPLNEGAWVADRQAVMLGVEDLGLLRVFTYEELWGDPFGPERMDEAIRKLSEIVAGRLRDSLVRQFGGEVDPTPAVTQLRRRGEALVRDLASSYRANQFEDDAVREANMTAVFRTHGLRPLRPGGSEEDALGPVLEWARDLCAAALSMPDRPIEPADLAFWPTVEDVVDRFQSGEDGPDPELAAVGEQMLAAVLGVYGTLWGHELRVEASVRMPGRLVATDGMPDGDDGAVWLLDQRDMSRGRSARAVSVELNRQALVDLGARRDFGAAGLLELVGVLQRLAPPQRAVLEEAIRKRSLAPLREAGLLQILDPSLPPWPEP